MSGFYCDRRCISDGNEVLQYDEPCQFRSYGTGWNIWKRLRVFRLIDDTKLFKYSLVLEIAPIGTSFVRRYVIVEYSKEF